MGYQERDDEQGTRNMHVTAGVGGINSLRQAGNQGTTTPMEIGWVQERCKLGSSGRVGKLFSIGIAKRTFATLDEELLPIFYKHQVRDSP